MMDERRKEPRVPLEDQVVVTVKRSSGADDLTGTTVACSTADISPNGLRLCLERNVEPGSLLALWVKRIDAPGTLSLGGTVRWCNGPDARGYWIGVELSEQTAEALAMWRKMLGPFDES